MKGKKERFCRLFGEIGEKSLIRITMDLYPRLALKKIIKKSHDPERKKKKFKTKFNKKKLKLRR